LLGLVGLAYGPLGAYLPELFASRSRYTGAGLTYNLGGVAVVLVVAAPLAASAWGAQAIGVHIAVTLLISIACLLALPKTRGRALAEARRRPGQAARAWTTSPPRRNVRARSSGVGAGPEACGKPVDNYLHSRILPALRVAVAVDNILMTGGRWSTAAAFVRPLGSVSAVTRREPTLGELIVGVE
jgi:MFS family permease